MLFRSMLRNPSRGRRTISASKLKKSMQVEEHKVDGFDLITASSKDHRGQHILFLHGGAYVAEANMGHRNLIKILIRQHGFRVSFLDYPLAPEYEVLKCHEVLRNAWDLLCEAYPDDELTLLGDSAGGGLALALLQDLRDRKALRRPVRTVLFSPWLDISMANPEISNFVKKDVLLDLEGLKKCGVLYAGGLELRDPRLSPIFGKMDDLSDIMVFVSTHELFYPDCLRFKEAADLSHGTRVDLRIWKGQVHDWSIFPLPESSLVIQQAARFFAGNFASYQHRAE